MGSLPFRINRISENLRLIQNEIALLAEEEFGGMEASSVDKADVNALRGVKLSVDHLRQVLRSYIDFASAQAEGHEQFAETRTQRTSVILRYACQGLQLRERKNREVPASLFEQLMVLAFAAVDRQKSMVPPLPGAGLAAESVGRAERRAAVGR
jgi:hypothetical protein